MTRPYGLILLLSLALGLPTATWAQTLPPDAFTSLMRTLKRGDTVVVVDVDGRKVKGEVAGLSESTLALDVSERLSPTGRLEFLDARVFEVVRRDSLLNGTLIGLGTGLASAIGFVRYNCGPPGYDDECTVIATVVSAAFLPVGAGLGALTDFLITRTVYRRPGSPTMSVAPILGQGRRGMTLTLRF